MGKITESEDNSDRKLYDSKYDKVRNKIKNLGGI